MIKTAEEKKQKNLNKNENRLKRKKLSKIKNK